MKLKSKTEIIFLIVAGLTFFFLNKNDLQVKKKIFNNVYKIKSIESSPAEFGFPDRAMKFYFEQRAYPIGKIPEGWRKRALAQIQANNSVSLKKAKELQWAELGPNNIGGRVRSIVVDPTDANVVYVGSVSGGIWKTTDGGSKWIPLKDFMENLSVSSLVIDPNHHNTIWAGTGEGFYNLDAIRGEGIFKTTDGGATWVQLPSTKTSEFYYVNKLAFDASTNILWAATRKGLYYSTDGGTTFNARLVGSNGGNVHCTDLEISNSNPSIIIAAFGLFNPSQIWRSTDGGQSFAFNYNLTGVGRIEMAIAPSNKNLIWASFYDLKDQGIGKMALSANGGTTWDSTKVVPGPSYSGAKTYAGKQGWYDNILAIDPDNPNIVWAGGIDLWKTTNGGSSWKQISNWYKANGYQYIHADFHAIVFAPSNHNIIYVGNDGGIYKSTDRGKNWTKINNNLSITQFYYGAVDPVAAKYYAGAQDNGTLKSSGSTSWFQILSGDGGVVEVDYNNPDNVYMEYVNLALFKSTSGGLNPQKIMNGIPTKGGYWDGTKDRTLFISPFIMDPNDPDILVAGTYRVFKTTNGGTNWKTISGDLTGDGTGSSGAKISTLAIAKGNSNVIYAGCSNGVISVTTDGGLTWSDSTKGLPNLYCTRISISSSNPAVAVASFSGFYNYMKVYKTTDYGLNWTNISGNLPNIPIDCILMLPGSENKIVAGTDLGVFVTLDGGASWTQMNKGMANVPVFDLDYRNGDDMIFAATHGRGMFRASASVLTEVKKDELTLPSDFTLEQNYPNPFNPTTRIAYSIGKSTFVELKVFNTLGEEVATLVSQEENAGKHVVTFNARNLASGAYYYKLKAGDFVKVRKMILLK